jgi:prepilin-type processing-associated H-X9-DG protein
MVAAFGIHGKTMRINTPMLAYFQQKNECPAPGGATQVFRVLGHTLPPKRLCINDGLFAIDMSNTGRLDGQGASQPYWIIDFPASYRDGAANVSFADGHVKRHRWLEPTTAMRLRGAQRHVSPTDRDLQGLQEHCTYLKKLRSDAPMQAGPARPYTVFSRYFHCNRMGVRAVYHNG